MPRLSRRYLLVSPITYYQGEDGSVWIDRLWHRDLVAHLDYLTTLTVIAPCQALPRDGATPEMGDLVRLDLPPEAGLTFAPLPHAPSARASLQQLPRTFLGMLRAVRRNDLVHSGVAGWPYPLGLLANPLAVLFRKPLIIVIEGSPWRVGDRADASLKARLRSVVVETFARWSARRAHLNIVTSTAYRDDYTGSARGRTLVTPASWLDEAQILDDGQAERSWDAKAGPLRVLFAGRLTEEKGVRVLLDAARRLDERGLDLCIDIVGEGALRQECERAAAGLAHVRMKVLAPVSYGPDFYALVRSYHAVVVPTLSDEQPRIIYDAFSQAVPVVATDTGGNRDCVIDGRTGVMVRPGDSDALAGCLERLARDPGRLRDLGRTALQTARGYTHREMHGIRAQVLHDLFAAA